MGGFQKNALFNDGFTYAFASRMNYHWRNTSTELFILFVIDYWVFFIRYITSITAPGLIFFTILLSFARIHGTILNLSWCPVWWGRFFVDFLIVSYRITVKHQSLWPRTEELWSISLCKMILNAKGLLLFLFMTANPSIFSLWSYSPLNG